jgi:hypothetical protein
MYMENPMISFKNFLNESQWMYHGSPEPNLTYIRSNKSNYSSLDTQIGAHFASNPEISKKFSSGLLYPRKNGQGGIKGAVYKTKRPTRSELETVPQKKGQHYDDESVAFHVLSSLFSHPDHKDLFVKWHRNKFASTQEQASNVHEKLSNKKNIPFNKKEYGYDKSNMNTFRSYIEHHGPHSFNDEDIHHEIVNKFIDHMKSKGKKGLVYQNTQGVETAGARSPKSYIIFEPEKLKVEKHEEMK